MVYVRAFSRVPCSACKNTGMLEVSKGDGRWQYRMFPASQVVRLCPLAPVIRGRAARDIDRDNVLERYTDFYLNKYRNLDDYMFISADIL
jgi:hypothetical protein